jgi:O-6-methylguanine DNA methyltransferase
VQVDACTYTASYRSEIGRLALTASEDALWSCTFVEEKENSIFTAESPQHPLLSCCLTQLHAYFTGQLQNFSVPLDPHGSLFATQVWAQLLKIPYAQTVSYKDLATALGRPNAARAVGQANHRNPIAILIPCHRVIGHHGEWGGYGGGVWRKEWLVAHEKRQRGGRFA